MSRDRIAAICEAATTESQNNGKIMNLLCRFTRLRLESKSKGC
jgi:hypothetical protein